jgi:FkbM family methyltransferase
MTMENELKYTSQYGQDKWLVESHFKHLKNGYFVDVAAGNGIFLSNTYVFEHNLGWTGICVEANDDTYAELTKIRNLCDNNCILDDGSVVNFNNTTNSTGWEHLLSGIDGLVHYATVNDSTVSKTTISLQTLLDNHTAPDIIDYISMDIEGAELQVLTEFFKTNKRKILTWTIEHSDEKQVIALMESNGYKLLGKIGADNVFELNKKAMLVIFTPNLILFQEVMDY